jgi:hypothetical protein
MANKKLKELEAFKNELISILNSINDFEKFIEKNKNDKWVPSTSRQLGTLRHRFIAVKATMTKISKYSTRDFFN